MATFPTLTPSSRTFTPGRHPHSEIPTLDGLQTRVRTSNVILEQQLRFTFIALTEAQMLSIRSHYLGQQGRFLSFGIPTSLLSGMTTPAYFTPTGYSWIYASSPQIEDIPCTQRYTVSIELVTVPPEGANAKGADFTVSIGLVAGAASVSGVATGADLIVTASIEGGVPEGDVEFGPFGFDISILASLAAGAASVENYEVFLSSGTWNWTAAGSPSTVDVLLVAGGGGGGAWRGGGGGAGGVRVATAVSVNANVSVTIGAGGNGNTAGSTPTAAQNGGLSSFGAQQAAGGGRGGIGQNSNNAGGNGGSGGGAGGAAVNGAQSAGTATSGQGNNGGSSNNNDDVTLRVGGGGGGKNAAGQNATTSAAGNGGSGVTLASLGFDEAVALGAPSSIGGGGGASSNSVTDGTGGTGGGGNGNRTGNAFNGTANTGGGGGGAGGGANSVNTGGNGGSGLVIVRWIS